MRAQQQFGVLGRGKTTKKGTERRLKGEIKKQESKSRREFAITRAIGEGQMSEKGQTVKLKRKKEVGK
jgi:hypothetical protein